MPSGKSDEVIAGARQSAAARELNVPRNAIHTLWNPYERDQNSNKRHGIERRRTPSHVQRIATCYNVPDTGGHYEGDIHYGNSHPNTVHEAHRCGEMMENGNYLIGATHMGL
ncbi:hypothetical protein HNY73_003394 [Argiope bruennichi]|uniref:Uncharacterized protein n=1 Tax=Argiope bruennichi TaxID=94029 RepID=A0A8T0FL01_ARGBR|nr:hypothetical protein HNY73_003394 [Argiope bruennichi]